MCGRTRYPYSRCLEFRWGRRHAWGSFKIWSWRRRWIHRWIFDQLPNSKLEQYHYLWNKSQMEVSYGWEYLLHWVPMDPLGLIISWPPVLLVEPVVLTSIITGEANVVDPMVVLPSRGVVMSMQCRITSAEVWKTLAALRAASVTIFFEKITRRACKVSQLPAASPDIIWSISGVVTGMISGMSRLINILRGEFMLVVSVSVTFLFFPSLVWVATFGSLFGLLSVSSFSEF